MMGSNIYGQLGIGDLHNEFPTKEWSGAPCLVDRLRDQKVLKVRCGKNSTFAII
jgi:alpha-tubulin suppressor-like RCC1 family protein